MNQDLHNILHGVNSIVPGVKTAAVTGSGIDLLGYQGAEVLIPVGTRTDSSFPVVLKECATAAGTYSSVADGDILGSKPTISGVSNTVYAFGYKGDERYLRVDTTFAAGGASAGAAFGAVVVRGYKRHEAGA